MKHYLQQCGLMIRWEVCSQNKSFISNQSQNIVYSLLYIPQYLWLRAAFLCNESPSFTILEDNILSVCNRISHGPAVIGYLKVYTHTHMVTLWQCLPVSLSPRGRYVGTPKVNIGIVREKMFLHSRPSFIDETSLKRPARCYKNVTVRNSCFQFQSWI